MWKWPVLLKNDFFSTSSLPKRRYDVGRQNIQMPQTFNGPVETIFNIPTDREALGSMIKKAMEKSVREGLQGLATRHEIQ
jgi:hypothetical protein